MIADSSSSSQPKAVAVAQDTIEFSEPSGRCLSLSPVSRIWSRLMRQWGWRQAGTGRWRHQVASGGGGGRRGSLLGAGWATSGRRWQSDVVAAAGIPVSRHALAHVQLGRGERERRERRRKEGDTKACHVGPHVSGPTFLCVSD